MPGGNRRRIPEGTKEATVKRLIVIELDDTKSRLLQGRRSAKEMKRLVRSVADQLAWGDTKRELRDADGHWVGTWVLTSTVEATSE